MQKLNSVLYCRWTTALFSLANLFGSEDSQSSRKWYFAVVKDRGGKNGNQSANARDVIAHDFHDPSDVPVSCPEWIKESVLDPWCCLWLTRMLNVTGRQEGKIWSRLIPSSCQAQIIIYTYYNFSVFWSKTMHFLDWLMFLKFGGEVFPRLRWETKLS